MNQKQELAQSVAIYDVVIGIEVHVQLNTKTKIFCSCSTVRTTEPNKNICVVCTAQPGSLPVVNKEVIKSAITAGLATHCTINTDTIFSRKHYFYPDLPKNYQITQNDKPICIDGFLEINTFDGTSKKIRIKRIHMEEDAGKNIHAQHTQLSYVDLNRAGTPLLEIVTEPDISSAYEAKEYLKSLHGIMKYLKISSVNMQDGAFRADTNISLKKKGSSVLGTRVELKNINSFKFIGDAIEYEIVRQTQMLQQGLSIKQETRLWDTKQGITKPMRSKEEAADYRYYDDPDLPALHIKEQTIQTIKNSLPELPAQKIYIYQHHHHMGRAEAETIVFEPAFAQFYESAYALHPSKGIANLLLKNFITYLKESNRAIEQCFESLITPRHIAELVKIIDEGMINNTSAQEVFNSMTDSGAYPLEIVQQKGLQQIGSVEQLQPIVLEIISQNPLQANEYRQGKHKLLGFFAGKVMQRTQGKANPVMIQQLIIKHLS